MIFGPIFVEPLQLIAETLVIAFAIGAIPLVSIAGSDCGGGSLFPPLHGSARYGDEFHLLRRPSAPAPGSGGRFDFGDHAWLLYWNLAWPG